MDTGVLPKPVPFGKYCLLEKISVGGMAEVYKAKAFGVEGFERLLAVKKILNSIAEDETFISMFIDEAKIAGQLNHPNIAQIFDLGKVDGSYFIALEYVSGRDLRTVWDRFVRDGTKPDIFLACHVVMKVGEALHYAHSKKDASGQDLNIVHRDISPHNILISYEGDVKIIDFGIAKAQGKSSQTQVGILKGKFSYMSPEQVRGLHIDHRADLFSLGIVLYELLTHERLFLGESDFDTLEKIRKVEMSPPTLYNPHIPRELEDIVLKALAKSPDDRFQSGMEFYDTLERFLRNQGSFFGSKDVGMAMKKTFANEIELERKKLDYYRTINVNSLTAAKNNNLGWEAEDLDTRVYGRANGQMAAPPPMPAFGDINPAAEFGHNRRGGYGSNDFVRTPEADIVYKTGEMAVPVGGIMPGLPNVNDLGLGIDDDEVDDPTMEFDRWSVGNSLTPQIQEAAPPPPPSPRDSGVMRAAAPVSMPPTMPQPPMPQEPSLFGGPEPVQAATLGSPHATIAPAQRERSGGGGALWAVLAIGLLVVAGGVAAWFLVPGLSGPATGTVTFQIPNVDKVEILVDDKVTYTGPTSPKIELSDISPGSRKFVVKADGYTTTEDLLSVEAGQQLTVRFEMKKAPEVGKAAISVKVEPADATVTINGEKVNDPAPFSRRDLAPGKYELVFAQEGYLEEKREVELSEGKTEDLDIRLRPSAVTLAVKPDPADAQVTIYQKDSPTAAERRKVKTNKGETEIKGLDARKFYEVEIEKKGFMTVTKLFEPGYEASKTLLPKLEAEGGGDAVAANGGGEDPVAAVRAQEERRKRWEERLKNNNNQGGGGGKTPPDNGGDNGGGGAANANNGGGGDNGGGGGEDPDPVVVKNTPPAQQGPGILNVSSKPAARVFIDGKDTGRYTPLLNYEISSGPHKVTLKNPEQGLNKTYSITIQAGKAKSILNLPQ